MSDYEQHAGELARPAEPTPPQPSSPERPESSTWTLKRWRAWEPCPGCHGEYHSFGPGRLSQDRATEIRIHDGEDGCGTQIHTTPYFIPETPSEATTWGLG